MLSVAPFLMYNPPMLHYLISIDLKHGGRVRRASRVYLYLFAFAVVGASFLLSLAYLSNGTAGLGHDGHYPLQPVMAAANPAMKEYIEAHVELREAVIQDRMLIDHTTEEAGHKMDAMAVRLSALQGQVMRMESLGKRIADMAGLDQEEFDLDAPVGLGGPTSKEDLANSYANMEMMVDLATVENRLTSSIDKLMVLEAMLMDKHFRDLVLPAGTPVPGGWISSSYGTRADPFSGKREFHQGIDIAAKRGSNILAAAPGMVVFSGYRPGYGNIIEIQHAEDFVTRYGHNKKNLVVVGETVKKSQPIAIIGSTGRSTGLHVHFEVLKANVPVNPARFVKLK